MALDEPEENECPVKINSLEVLIADTVKPLIEDKIIDYKINPDGEGFVITPECGSSCCG
jgi:Fe-S cluster assembly iron-binding protein IscA